YRLPETVLNDARGVRDVLIDPAQGGYASQNVQLLLDDRATLAGVRQALTALGERSNSGSTVFIYLSCHGARIDSGPSTGEFLLPVDANAAAGALAATSISGAEFSAALRAIPARKVVVVFDCCNSGGIGQPKS